MKITDELQKEKPTYVYRIMPLRYFLATMKSRMLYLPRVSKWEDPYELFLFKQKYLDTSGKPVDILTEANRIYGQCWTTARDSDALWRIYSPDRMSVRIKTTIEDIQKLANTIVGKRIYVKPDFVTYKSKNNLESYIKNITSVPSNNIMVESLFIKRTSFEHEKEFRIIAWYADFDENNNYIPNSPDYFEIPFPDDFIKEVFLDPRLSPEEVVMLKSALSLRLGGKCPISQSTLYKFKQHTIQL